MFSVLRRLSGRAFLNPLTRTAIMTFAWAHRHEVLRWGRSLWDHLARRDLDPSNALATAKVLYAVAADERFRDAKELRKVTMDDGVVKLEVHPRWRQLAPLVGKLRDVEGVTSVVVNGAVDETVAPTAPLTARAQLPES